MFFLKFFFDLSAHFLPMNDIFALAEGMELLNGKYTIISFRTEAGRTEEISLIRCL